MTVTDVALNHVDCYVFRWEGDDLRYLMLKRRRGTYYGHLWQGVAGKKMRSETAVETAIREVTEETGLRPVRLVVVDYMTSFYQSHHDRIHLVPVFGVEVGRAKVLLSDEHTEFKWVDLQAAQSLLSWRQQKEALRVLHQMLTEDDGRIKWSEVDLAR